MATILKTGKAVITIHATREDGVPDQFVSAALFKLKLSAFLAALKEADVEMNAVQRRSFYVSRLTTGSAEIELRESTPDVNPQSSAFSALSGCAQAINDGDIVRLKKRPRSVQRIGNLSSGAGKKFSHITFSLDEQPPIRIDCFFNRQAKRMRLEINDDAVDTPFYRGVSEEVFDGVVKEIDLRGRAPLCKLILSGSGMEIDCTFYNFTTEGIREALDRRAWVSGKAIYDGLSGLPARLEITSLQPIGATGDPRRWLGSLKPYEEEDWTEFASIN